MAVIKTHILIALSFCLLFTGCIEESEDEQDPEITIFQGGEEAETLVLVAGETTSFQASIIDESALHSYKTYITFEQDTTSYACQLESEWVHVQVSDEENDTEFYEINVQVPDSVRGFYDLEFEVFDTSGNLASATADVIISTPNLSRFINLTMDSVKSTCEFFSDSLSVPALFIEAESNVPFSQVLFYERNITDELISSYSVSNVDYLNESFQIYPEIPETSSDTILIELKSIDEISIWSSFILENQ